MHLNDPRPRRLFRGHFCWKGLSTPFPAGFSPSLVCGSFCFLAFVGDTLRDTFPLLRVSWPGFSTIPGPAGGLGACLRADGP